MQLTAFQVGFESLLQRLNSRCCFHAVRVGFIWASLNAPPGRGSQTASPHDDNVKNNKLTWVEEKEINLYGEYDEQECEILITWLSSPSIRSMKKKSAAQRGATGIRLTAFGYAMKARPGPEAHAHTHTHVRCLINYNTCQALCHTFLFLLFNFTPFDHQNHRFIKTEGHNLSGFTM